MTYSLPGLLIFFWLTVVFLTKSKYKLQRKPIVKEIITDIHFHLFLILMLKNLFFFSCRVKSPYQQLFKFSQFHEHSKSNETVISQRCKRQLGPNIFFFSTLLRDIIWYIKIQTRLFICFLSIAIFFQITFSKAENWHVSSHEQYLSKHRFLDICRCVFKKIFRKDFEKKC